MASVIDHNSKTIPDVFWERYRAADSAALKVALYIFENGIKNEDEIGLDLNIPLFSVKRSLDFWRSAGLFNNSENEKEQDTSLKPVKHRLSHSDVASALLSDDNIATLLQETQKLLGRELSFSESRLLVETIQETGLDAQCILMLEEYYLNTEHSKKVLTDSCRSARSMTKEIPVSYKSFEEQITLMEVRYYNLKKVSELLGIDPSEFTKKEKGLITRIFEEFGYDCTFISEVLTRKPDATVPYIFTVLKDWNRKGYRSISDARLLSLSADTFQISAQDSKKTETSTFMNAVKRNRKDR